MTKIGVDFLYTIGEVTCNSESFNEFVENSFGQSINLIRMNISIQEGETPFKIFICVTPKRKNKNISISCNNRINLNIVIDKITEIKSDTLPVLIDTQNNYINSIVINDDAVVNNSNIINQSHIEETNQYNKQGFWKKIS